MIPTLDSIKLDLSSWVLDQREEFMAVWTDDDGDVLALNFFPLPPDVPTNVDLVRLRDDFRQKTAAQGAGIIEVDAAEVDGIDCIWLILKARPASTGALFQGSCIIPRQDFSFVVRVQGREAGEGGPRDATVMQATLPRAESGDARGGTPAGRIEGWFKDPYDERFDATALRTLADDEKYDAQFPGHALSRVRRKLRAALASLRIDESIRAAPAHGRIEVR